MVAKVTICMLTFAKAMSVFILAQLPVASGVRRAHQRSISVAIVTVVAGDVKVCHVRLVGTLDGCADNTIRNGWRWAKIGIHWRGIENVQETQRGLTRHLTGE